MPSRLDVINLSKSVHNCLLAHGNWGKQRHREHAVTQLWASQLHHPIPDFLFGSTREQHIHFVKAKLSVQQKLVFLVTPF